MKNNKKTFLMYDGILYGVLLMMITQNLLSKITSGISNNIFGFQFHNYYKFSVNFIFFGRVMPARMAVIIYKYLSKGSKFFSRKNSSFAI